MSKSRVALPEPVPAVTALEAPPIPTPKVPATPAAPAAPAAPTEPIAPAAAVAAPVAPRRSGRFVQPGSPGRRCTPCHHDKTPDASSLKYQIDKDDSKAAQGFYSKASLELYLKKANPKPRNARRRRLRKKVSWSSSLEW